MLGNYKLESLLKLCQLVILLHFYDFEKGAFQANEAWKWRVLAFTKLPMILEGEEMAFPLYYVKTTVIHHRDTTSSMSLLHLRKQYDETVQDCSPSQDYPSVVFYHSLYRNNAITRLEPSPLMWSPLGHHISTFYNFDRLITNISSMNAWYCFSNKMILEGEIKDARMSSFSSDF